MVNGESAPLSKDECELAAMVAWLEAALPDHPPPYQFELIAAGGSNLTYIVTSGKRERFVLRRPPLRARIATAHDMQREYRIMTALRGTATPVPAMLAYCSEPEPGDSEFYCMEFIEGLALREAADCARMSAVDCVAATESLLDAQVSFHQLDLEAVGLADLAQHEAYLQRQLKRWKRQVEMGGAQPSPRFAELHERLCESAPAGSCPPGLAHGDYRFDNCLLDRHYRIKAVLDWELCTIGDPIADFVWSLNYWAQPGETLTWLMSPPTWHPAFPSRAEVMRLYEQKAGISLVHLDWYNAFSWWKQACIVEGVRARLRQGAGGGMKVESLDAIGSRIDQYLLHSGKLLQALA